MEQGALSPKASGLMYGRICRDLRLPEGSRAADQMGEYCALLEKWNRRVNLTASTSWESMAPLFREAAFGAELYPECEAQHLDIGSGGGFPALPMKIMRPAMHLTMVESRLKRSVFLRTAIRELHLAGAEVFDGRLREILESPRASEGWDFVSWKGIKLETGDLESLLERSGAATQFWMFHGRDLPLCDPEVAVRHLRLFKRHVMPWNPESCISIYLSNR